MANVTLSSMATEAAIQYGRLFYIISPKDTSFAEPTQVPDYVQQAMPYMVTLIIIEALINWLGRGQRHNIADSVTSISCGLAMTMVGLFSKAACLSTYAWVHTHYRLVDLPWSSPWTWVLTAVLVDLGYYWFHRASHEVGVLWAVHQVHHSSEEFNLTTAFRQPFFQGLFQLTHWFYLPAALAVPPSQFLVHSQFVFLFQFWIHSELIGDIGPLGLIFNTSTYHQVHHGSNRYCLDKNYGGFLSIWDRIFGTFQDLRPDEQTVYGLIDQPQFFNLVKHQFFYFPVLLGKVEGGPWWQKIAVWFLGPGWFPGLPRMGDNNLCPEIPEREKHFTDLPIFAHVYLAVQVAACFVLHDDLSRLYPTMSQGGVLVIMGAILTTLTSVSLHYDHSRMALPLEVLRCSAGLALVILTGGWKAGSLSPTALSVWLGSSLALSLAKSFFASSEKVKDA